MSEMTRLSELGQFQPRSPLASDDDATRAQSLRLLARGLGENKPVHRRMSDMLSVVLALSSRTRRMVLPRVAVDVDVFDPAGRRALRMYMPQDD